MAVGICPICGRNEQLNIEHALPQWLRRHAHSVAAGQPFVGTLASGSLQAPAMPLTRVTVGKDCNSWMGRTFESPTKPVLIPLIDGVPHSMLPTGQALVARWATKTALVSVLDEAASMADVYRVWRQSGGDPPPGTRVHVGHYLSPGKAPADTRQRVPSGIDAAFLGYPNIVGQLVVVVCIPLRGRPVRTVAEARGGVVPIWPPTGTPITWPLLAGLDVAGVESAFTWQPA